MSLKREEGILRTDKQGRAPRNFTGVQTMSSTRLSLITFATTVLGASALAANPAAAFFCYVPEKPESPVALREKPHANARIVARMPPSSMVREAKGKSRHNGWVRVIWYADQATKKETGRGWVIYDQIYGGECED